MVNKDVLVVGLYLSMIFASGLLVLSVFVLKNVLLFFLWVDIYIFAVINYVKCSILSLNNG